MDYVQLITSDVPGQFLVNGNVCSKKCQLYIHIIMLFK